MPLVNIDIEVKNPKKEQFENNCLLMKSIIFKLLSASQSATNSQRYYFLILQENDVIINFVILGSERTQI